MSVSNEADDRRPNTEGSDEANSSKGKRKRGAAPSDLGQALKTVYDQTVKEAVPDDFMELLGKLN